MGEENRFNLVRAYRIFLDSINEIRELCDYAT